MRKMLIKFPRWCADGMKYAAVPVAVLLLAGCFSRSVATYEEREGFKKSTIRLAGTGDKASEIAAEGLFADEDGAGVSKANASQQSSGIADSMRAFGDMTGVIAQAIGVGIGIGRGGFVAEAGGAVGNTSGAFAGNVAQGTPDSTAYSPDGFAGQPGPDGTGVYGRPSCGRCQAYKRAHPDTAIINIDEPGNRSAMWNALRSRGYGAGSVGLPVLITAEAYTTAAK